MKVDRTIAAAVGTTTLQNTEGMKYNIYNNFKFQITVKVKVMSCNSLHKSALLFTWLVFKYLYVCWR